MVQVVSKPTKSSDIQQLAGGMVTAGSTTLSLQVPTLIAHKFQPEMCSSEEAAKGTAVLLAIRKVLNDKNTPDDICLDKLLDKAGVLHSTYFSG